MWSFDDQNTHGVIVKYWSQVLSMSYLSADIKLDIEGQDQNHSL